MGDQPKAAKKDPAESEPGKHAAQGPTRDGDSAGDACSAKVSKIDTATYEAELYRLQAELVTLQEWLRATGNRLAVIFEGRDAAGKGGTIKRFTQYLNPRVARIAALPAPSPREKTEWYFQRYIAYLPAGGEMTLFDRSWYNRAGVERVMGFCTQEEYHHFLRQCPVYEQLLVDDGIMLRKYWFSVSDAEQERRFQARLTDPMRQWKLSPMDFESITRWEEYSQAKDQMMLHTSTKTSPWFAVESDSKKRARLNMIAHLLSTIPYERVHREAPQLPKRPKPKGYDRPPKDAFLWVPDHAATLTPASA